MNAVDAARASGALFEIERCLRMLRSGERCARLDVVHSRRPVRTSDPLVSEIRFAAIVFFIFLVVTIVALAHVAVPS